ncbi:MAG TPA: SDR family NAD(P)-dependent oxidoreductase [Vicinamibacterales bacterium]|nr:SDR family NAD(P)-dependent oxidoreductase [Vicinamibacterales bacterium]
MRTVLITGGTGSFGHAATQTLLESGDRVIVFSRDEVKQAEMARLFGPAVRNDQLRFFIGDVRDGRRLARAFGAHPDLVLHAAALKRVESCEANPLEAIATNVLGAVNVVNAALDAGVPKVVALSTDKACAPLNTYGKTKALAESVFVRGNSYAGARPTRFSVVRYGNVIGSRGSVVPLFLEQREAGEIRITDRRMTRFWMPIGKAVDFVFGAADVMQGGEIFVPKIPSAHVIQVAKAIAPDTPVTEIGLRPGEKLHELLISTDEGPQARDIGEYYELVPIAPTWTFIDNAQPVPAYFSYSSDMNPSAVKWTEEVCASR